jgi:hypothetical protein
MSVPARGSSYSINPIGPRGLVDVVVLGIPRAGGLGSQSAPDLLQALDRQVDHERPMSGAIGEVPVNTGEFGRSVPADAVQHRGCRKPGIAVRQDFRFIQPELRSGDRSRAVVDQLTIEVGDLAHRDGMGGPRKRGVNHDRFKTCWSYRAILTALTATGRIATMLATMIGREVFMVSILLKPERG